jgi:hypothetical protein
MKVDQRNPQERVYVKKKDVNEAYCNPSEVERRPSIDRFDLRRCCLSFPLFRRIRTCFSGLLTIQDSEY